MSAAANPDWTISRKTRVRAKSLRRNATDAERILWSALRAHRLRGSSFRRQVPIGSYIADFVCHTAKLVIEIDGGQHFSTEGERHDARRSTYFASKGFRVLRFSNLDIMTNRDGVIEAIASQIKSATAITPPPYPSPARGGGE